MSDRITPKQIYPLGDVDVLQAFAKVAKNGHDVAITIVVTPDEAYKLAGQCTRNYQAGFAGQVCLTAFFAKLDIHDAKVG